MRYMRCSGRLPLRNGYSLLMPTFLALATLILPGAGELQAFEPNPPTFTLLPESRTVFLDERITLECAGTYQGRSAREVVWYGSTQLLDIEGVNTRTLLDNSSLVLDITEFDLNASTNANPSSNVGVFHCLLVFYNDSTPVEQQLNLSFLSPPFKLSAPDIRPLMVEPKDTAVHPGDTASFECIENSEPRAHYSWRKFPTGTTEVDASGGEAVEGGGRFRVFADDGMLEIENVTSSDYAVYVCVATVKRGLDQNATTVSGGATLSENTNERQFQITAPPYLTSAREGSAARFFCVGSSKQPGHRPTVSWYLHGDSDQLLDTVSPASRYRIEGSTTLVINNVRREDSGSHFLCRIVDADGTSRDSLPAPLAVKYPPSFTVPPQNTYAVVGTPLEWPCEAEGQPTPTMLWIKRFIVFRQDHRDSGLPVTSRHLSIPSVENSDAGFYMCVAQNGAGGVHKFVELQVVTGESQRPGSSAVPIPSGLVVNALRSHSADISWSVSGSVLVSRYNVTYWETGSTRLRSVVTEAQQATLPDLNQEVEYQVKVVALNSEQMASYPSEVISFTTVQGPPGQCQSVKVVVNSTGLMLSWKAPLVVPGDVQYRIKVVGDQTFDFTTRQLFQSVGGLTPGTKYILSVLAVNEHGEGLRTVLERETRAAEKAEAPDLVLVGSFHPTNITLYWRSPSEAVLDESLIQGYKIKWKPKVDSARFSFHIVEQSSWNGLGSDWTAGTAAWTYDIGGLSPSTTYKVCVAVQTAAGIGHYKCAQKETIAEELIEVRPPPSPTSVTVEAGSTSIDISWAQSYDPVIVRGFKILCVRPEERSTHIALQIHPLRNTHHCGNLDPDTDYKVTLHSFNNAGASSLIAKNAHTLRTGLTNPNAGSGLPLPLLDVDVEVMNARKIRVSWREYANTSHSGVTYTVRYLTVTGHRREQFSQGIAGTSVEITGLVPYTKYDVSVMSTRGGVKSKYTDPTRVTTLEAPMEDAPSELTIAWLPDGDEGAGFFELGGGPSGAGSTGRSSGGRRPSSTRYNMQATWMEPDQPNGRVLSYHLQYKFVDAHRADSWLSRHVSGDRLSTIVTHLTADTEYVFRIKGQNSKGWGPWSEEVRKKTRSETDASADNFGADLPDGPIPGEPGASGKDAERTLWIIIACVGGATLIAIVALIAVLCRKRITDRHRKGKKTNLKAMNEGVRGRGGQQPPDLWIHHEQRTGSAAGVTSPDQQTLELRAMNGGMQGHHRHGDDMYDMYDDMDAHDSQPMLLDHHGRHGHHPHAMHGGPHMIGDGCSSGADFDRSVSMGDTMNGDGPVYTGSGGTLGRGGSKVPVIIPAQNPGQPGYREGTPKATVLPLPNDLIAQSPSHQRAQYGGQQAPYGSAPRVHLGDTSVTPSGFNPDKWYHHPASSNKSYSGMPGASTPPSYNNAIPQHAVKPLSVDPSRPSHHDMDGGGHEADTDSPPASPGDSKVSLLPPHASPSVGPAGDGARTPDLSKTRSTEQLNLEIADLEVLMKDLNDMQNDFRA